MIENKYDEANRILCVNMYNENLVTAHRHAIYDLVIGNPPYIKVNKNVREAETANEILFGQPNMYMIFMFHSLKMLKQNGQLVFIVPRSFLMENISISIGNGYIRTILLPTYTILNQEEKFSTIKFFRN